MGKSCYTREETLPYRPEEVFDLVADIERYPNFVPGYESARIVKRQGNTWFVKQAVRVMGMPFSFDSTAVLDRPKSLRISGNFMGIGPFEVKWNLTGLPDDGTHVRFRLAYGRKGSLAQALLERGMTSFGRLQFDAFMRRANELYKN